MTMAQAVMLSAADVQPTTEIRMLGSIAVERGPIGDIAVSPNGTRVVATNFGDKSVSMLDGRSLTVRSTVPVDGDPIALAVAADRAFVGASLPTFDAVSAIDMRAHAFLASLPLDHDVVDVAASRDGRQLFVGAIGRDSVDLLIVDVESGRIDIVEIAPGEGTTLNTVRAARNGRLVSVGTSDIQGGRLTVIDTAKRRIVTTVDTDSPFRDVVLSEDGSFAYVLGCHPEYGGVVETFDVRRKRVVGAAWIGGCPTQFAPGADGTRMYIVDASCVVVLCMITHDVVDTITVGAQPSSVATSPDGSRLYVADFSGAVSVFAVASPSSFDDVIDVETVALAEVRELQPAGV
jgi:DNA-binding beta-propeller fold protein YncE